MNPKWGLSGLKLSGPVYKHSYMYMYFDTLVLLYYIGGGGGGGGASSKIQGLLTTNPGIEPLYRLASMLFSDVRTHILALCTSCLTLVNSASRAS